MARLQGTTAGHCGAKVCMADPQVRPPKVCKADPQVRPAKVEKREGLSQNGYGIHAMSHEENKPKQTQK